VYIMRHWGSERHLVQCRTGSDNSLRVLHNPFVDVAMPCSKFHQIGMVSVGMNSLNTRTKCAGRLLGDHAYSFATASPDTVFQLQVVSDVIDFLRGLEIYPLRWREDLADVTLELRQVLLLSAQVAHESLVLMPLGHFQECGIVQTQIGNAEHYEEYAAVIDVASIIVVTV
jgi:hypothetical protein